MPEGGESVEIPRSRAAALTTALLGDSPRPAAEILGAASIAMIDARTRLARRSVRESYARANSGKTTSARRNASPTDQAWNGHPFGVKGGSASAISESCPGAASE